MIKVFVGFLLGAAVGLCAMWQRPQIEDVETEVLLRELYRRFYKEIWTGLAFLLFFHSPYYWTILRWFFRLPKKYWAAILKDRDTIVGSINPIYNPERFVEGSDYVDGAKPVFQVALYCADGPTQWVFRGEGWRLGEHLVTAAHVVSDVEGIVRVRSGNAFVDVRATNFDSYELDLATAVLSQAEWASLAVKSAKIPRTAISSHQMVTCYSRGKYSTGVCSAYQSMPHVVYDGSTRPGCSGAPLFVGGTVYAMHVGAGKVNLGLDANWIQSVSFRPEASEDYVFNAIQEKFEKFGQKTKFKSFDNSEVYILSDGRYVTFASEDIPDRVRAALEYDSPYPVGYQNENVPTTYDRSDAGSLNLNRASVSVEARKLKVAAPAFDPNSPVQFALSPSQTSNEMSTDGPGSTYALLKRALDSMQQSQTESTPKSSHRRKKPSKKPKPMLPGDLRA